MNELVEYYHVLNRGNGKSRIFFSDENYQFFLRRMKKYLDVYKPVLVAYCLMPNHFHLLLGETVDGAIARFIHALQTSYSKALNKSMGKTGHLFQDTYKKIPIYTKPQLLQLSRYIHLNPVRAGLIENPEEWEYSSYKDYIGIRNGNIPKQDLILSHFEKPETYRDYVMDTMDEKDITELLLE
jgi:REP element-mobilizing transposase RayT